MKILILGLQDGGFGHLPLQDEKEQVLGLDPLR